MFKFLSIILAAIMTFTLTACGEGDKAETVATKFIQAVYKADVKDAMSYIDFSVKDAKDEVAAEEAKKMIEGKFSQMFPERKKEIDEKAGGVKEVKVTSVKYDQTNTKACVVVTVNFNGKYHGRTSNDEKVNLVKTDDGWKVNMM